MQKIDSLLLYNAKKTLVIDCLTYIQNILQPSLVGLFDVLVYLPVKPMPEFRT